MKRIYKQMFTFLLLITLVIGFFSCQVWERRFKDFTSSLSGINRTAYVYSANGELLKVYRGKFDIEVNEYGNKVKFDINGKRVLMYNVSVVIEEQGINGSVNNN